MTSKALGAVSNSACVSRGRRCTRPNWRRQCNSRQMTHQDARYCCYSACLLTNMQHQAVLAVFICHRCCCYHYGCCCCCCWTPCTTARP
jgi:hypothetical protein